MTEPRPVTLHGSCHCGRVAFRVDSFTPFPFMVCHCSNDTKTAGLFCSNIMGEAATLAVSGTDPACHRVYRASKASVGADSSPDAAAPAAPAAEPELSTHERHFCSHCGTALWAYDAQWPQWVYPYATAIDSPSLPAVAEHDQIHIFVRSRCAFAPAIPHGVPESSRFETYPTASIEAWHRSRGLYGTWKPE
ncbi:Mss4-like protein [Entophlyctis helioformis]|nr:Mss4-like protein [Entophlyctis helioformis]